MIHAFNGLAIKSQEVVKNVRHTLLEAPFFRFFFFLFWINSYYKNGLDS